MMKKFLFSFPFLALLVGGAFWLTQCRDIRDDDLPDGPTVRVAFAGQVIDENHVPIEGAKVSAGHETITTDINGVFRLPAIYLPRHDAKLRVSVGGYFDFVRAYVVEEGALQTVTVQMIRQSSVGYFQAGVGGTVSFGSGKAKLTFPANALVNADGSAFNGTVDVSACYLDPTSPDLPLQMPGDLRGIRGSGQEGVLSTFGMVGVDLWGNGPLKVAPGQEVELRMTIPADKVAVAPAQIPLWYFDADKARWIEEGSAQKVGNEYVGKVTHFSFWNCDAFSETVYLEGRILLNGSVPLNGVVVQLTVLSNGFQGYGYTNENGWYGGAVPKDYAMLLEVQVLTCNGQVIYTEPIGPFSDDVVLPAIVLTTATNALTVKGKVVNCNDQPVVNGYALLTQGTMSYPAFLYANGVFQSVINCGVGAGDLKVKAYDMDALLESAPATFSAAVSPLDVGNIITCTAVSEYVRYTLDNQQKLLPYTNGGYNSPRTYISASGNTNSLYFSFENNGQTGIYPLTDFSISQDSTNTVPNITTNLTTFGNVNEFLIGTFSGSYEDFAGNTHNISGDYRVKRNQ